jgi:polar amino acid transport system substrate-binding protein
VFGAQDRAVDWTCRMRTIGDAIAFGPRGFPRWRRLAALALAATLLLPAAAKSDALDQIRARGVLVVGTKADYQPFGFRDPSGAIVGFEPDLAVDVATALGVKLELAPVVTSNRIPLLTEGKIDLIIATMNDTPERHKLVDFVSPSYYASGVNVLAPKSLRLHVWQQLRGKPICMIDGAFYVDEIKQRYEPELRTFKNTNEMYDALTRDRCISVVYDDTAIIGQLQISDWREFEMPLLSILVEPWGMAVRLGENRLEKVLSDQVMEWHRTGRIVALEEQWHIPHSGFAEEMHRKYLATQ